MLFTDHISPSSMFKLKGSAFCGLQHWIIVLAGQGSAQGLAGGAETAGTSSSSLLGMSASGAKIVIIIAIVISALNMLVLVGLGLRFYRRRSQAGQEGNHSPTSNTEEVDSIFDGYSTTGSIASLSSKFSIPESNAEGLSSVTSMS